MRLSKNFVSDYIEVKDIDTKELAEKMVFAGNEYESIEKTVNASECVIGKVLECVDHEKSDHLHICKVDYGEGIKQIVCGAPNVKEGIKVIVAKVGAILGDIEIKKATLAGVESEGMLCALDELGVDKKYLKEDEVRGIHILDDDAPIGEDAIKYLGIDDEVIDFELTANRADLLSVLGMAYELGAIYNKKVKLPEINYEEIDENINDLIKLEVKTDSCKAYIGKIVKDVTIKESPDFIKNRLIASGIRPINNVVDISNYVMLETGQPMHFFDKDLLGNSVIVRDAQDGEKLTTLDNIERTLTSDDIVIANKNESLCLAGVMGGLSTEVTNNTKNVFIESAIFDSVKVRRTSSKIVRSESSNRFEKGIDPNRVKFALDRAVTLLSKYASAKVVKGIVEYDKTNKEDKIIDVTLTRINNVLGMNLTIDDVKDVFNRLEFKYDEKDGNFKVYVPTRRLDVNIECDIFEEVGRIYGYDKLEGKKPVLPVKKGGYSKLQKYINNLEDRLISLGLNQVRTYSLVNEKQSEMFLFRNFDKIEILSPLSEDRKILRRSLIPSLIEVYNYNKARNVDYVNIFEASVVNYKIDDEYIEENMISGLISSNLIESSWNVNKKIDFYTLKGIVTNLLDYIGLSGRYTFDTENLVKELYPYQSAYIKLDNEVVGYLGKVHPSTVKKDVYVFELSIDKLRSKKVRNIKYKEISKYPSITKDVAFITKKDVNSSFIENNIKKASGRLLTDIKVFDVYTGENVDEDEKSIAYKLTYSDLNRTLSDEEVNSLFYKMIDAVEKKCNVKLRNE